MINHTIIYKYYTILHNDIFESCNVLFEENILSLVYFSQHIITIYLEPTKLGIILFFDILKCKQTDLLINFIKIIKLSTGIATLTLDYYNF